MIVKPFDKSLLVMRELPLLGMNQSMGELLRTHFELEEDVYVFNHLVLPCPDHSQVIIDHLILTRWGIFLIDNFHVESRLLVDRHNTWFVVDAVGVKRYIPAPTDATESKKKAVRRLLNSNASRLLPKVLGMQEYFGTYPAEGFVAISANAVIERDNPNRGARVLPQQSTFPAAFRVMTELKVRADYYWLTRWFSDEPRVLQRHTTFEVARILQDADLQKSALSLELEAGPEHAEDGQGLYSQF